MSTYSGETESAQGELIYRGAEADIVRSLWMGLPAIFKVRKRLPYRLGALDVALRRQRTVHEADLIHSARRAGVCAPRLYFVDPPRTTLVMEYVDGTRLKEFVAMARASEVGDLFKGLGREVAKLHSAAITHGDLTTANVILRNGELVFIDFGLSSHSTRLEDHAVDLRLIKETLVGAHSSIASMALERFFNGYHEVAGPVRTRAVERQLKSIERRGRYARLA